MIALALACSPAMLVADEPTTGLDVTLTRSILALLRTAASEWNRAVLIISHDLAAIAEVCDRIAVLYAGTLVEEGRDRDAARAADPSVYRRTSRRGPRRLGRADAGARRRDAHARARRPRRARSRPGARSSATCCRQSVPRLVATAIGSRSACFVAAELAAGGDGAPAGPEATVAAPLPSAAGPAAPILRVADVAVVYRARFGRGGTRALRGVSLSVHRGETIGIVGESGCGKSTLARVMLGLLPPTSGAVELDGIELTALGAGAMRRLRRRSRWCSRTRSDSLSPRRIAGGDARDSMRLLELTPGEVSAADRRALARVALDATIRRPGRRTSCPAARRSASRSPGRSSLDPRVVVFDEPTSALDVTVQAQILELMRVAAAPAANAATSSSRTTSPPSAGLPTGSPSCTSAGSSRRARSTTCSPPAAPVHAGAARRRAEPARDARRQPRRAPAGARELGRRHRLRARAALPVRAPALHRRSAAARRGGARPRRGLLARRRARGLRRRDPGGTRVTVARPAAAGDLSQDSCFRRRRRSPEG